MPNENAAIAALVGSRLCHDLISPVGAIQNGLELLGLSGMDSDLPEMQLIEDSCRSAAARIRFFRVAFGTAGDGQMMGRNEITSILQELSREARVKAEWKPQTDLLRSDVQMAFLAFMCCESALPQGGAVRLERLERGWSIAAEGRKFAALEPFWAMLQGSDAPEAVSADKVQFAMMAALAQERGRQVLVHRGDDVLRLEIL